MFPRIALEYTSVKNGEMEWYYIREREYRLLDRPGHRCNSDKEYDMMKCVRNSQVNFWQSDGSHIFTDCALIGTK